MTSHAIYFNSPSGRTPIRESIRNSFDSMTDREVANKAFGENYVDDEYYSELVHRDLAGPGVSQKETLIRIELKEASANAPKMTFF